MQKSELRKIIRQRKSLYTNEALLLMSKEITDKLEAHPRFQSASTILLYHSLPDEVNTHKLIDKWADKKRILLPVVKGNILVLREYMGSKNLATSLSYGIEEPIGQDFTAYDTIDLAIIPGMAFDHLNHRLGRGKGYYDRLLPQLTRPYKLGICFPFQMTDEVPTEPHDIEIDEVIY